MTRVPRSGSVRSPSSQELRARVSTHRSVGGTIPSSRNDRRFTQPTLPIVPLTWTHLYYPVDTGGRLPDNVVVQSRPTIPLDEFSTEFGFDLRALELSALHQAQDLSCLNAAYTPSESSAGGSVASPGRSEHLSTWPATSSMTDLYGAQPMDFTEETYLDMMGLSPDLLDLSVREVMAPLYNDNQLVQEALLDSSQLRFQDVSHQEMYPSGLNLDLDDCLTQAPGRAIAPRPMTLPRTNIYNKADANPAGAPIRPRGRRQGSLNPEVRLNAGVMRHAKSCIRCHEFKERCDEGKPCKKCLAVYGKMRSFKFPCSKRFFKDRYDYLLHGLLVGHLDLKVYIKQLPPSDTYIGDAFELSLTQNFQPPLRISVKEYPHSSDRNEAALVKDIFPMISSAARYEVYHDTTMSLPLRPSIKICDLKKVVDQIQSHIKRWMTTTAEDEKAAWHLTYFPEEYGQAWPRAVLETICIFYHEALAKNCEPLEFALQATVIMYIQGHTFFIPRNEVPDVLKQLQQPPDIETVPYYVCPSYIDGFLKTILYPLLKNYLIRLFNEVHEMYPQSRPCTLSRDEFLCTSIVLLILVATLQGKFIEKAYRSRREGTEIMKEALERIREVEEQVVQPLFELWDFKFSVGDEMMTGQTPPERREISRRARSFGLVKKLMHLSSEHADELDTIDSELAKDIDPRTFGAMNTTRLLKKFHVFIFKETNRS